MDSIFLWFSPVFCWFQLQQSKKVILRPFLLVTSGRIMFWNFLIDCRTSGRNNCDKEFWVDCQNLWDFSGTFGDVIKKKKKKKVKNNSETKYKIQISNQFHIPLYTFFEVLLNLYWHYPKYKVRGNGNVQGKSLSWLVLLGTVSKFAERLIMVFSLFHRTMKSNQLKKLQELFGVQTQM